MATRTTKYHLSKMEKVLAPWGWKKVSGLMMDSKGWRPMTFEEWWLRQLEIRREGGFWLF